MKRKNSVLSSQDEVVLDQLLMQAEADDVEARVAAMSPEEKQHELEEAGVDLEEMRKVARARAETLRKLASPVIRPAARPSRWTRSLQGPVYVGIAAAALVGIGVAATRQSETPVALPKETVTKDEEGWATAKMDEAWAHCAEDEFAQCSATLDELVQRRPATASEERVVMMRKLITVDKLQQQREQDTDAGRAGQGGQGGQGGQARQNKRR